MNSNNFLVNKENYKYQHIYDVFSDFYKFDDAKYGDLLKDIIRVLIEFEKKGEPRKNCNNCWYYGGKRNF